MKIRIKTGSVEREMDIRFWDMVKIYLGVSLVASAIMLGLGLIILFIFGWLLPLN